MRSRRPTPGLFSCLVSTLLCFLLIAAPAASALQGGNNPRGAQVKENHPTKGAPGQNLPNLDEVRRRGPANPKALPPVPSKLKKCPPDEPNCNAPAGAGSPRADAGNGSRVAEPSRAYSLFGLLVAGVSNPYAGVMLASARPGLPEPPRTDGSAEQEPPPAGWLSSLASLLGVGAAARRMPVGGFENADCYYAWGYAWDSAQPNVPVIVALYDNNQPEPIATVLADRPRPDLVGMSGGDGRHGFRFELPESLRDGASHSLSVKIQGTGFTLGFSPKVISSCTMSYQGAITSADCDQVTGWAWDAGRPATPIDVDVFVDGVFGARVSADTYNSQLNKGDNRHQFRVPTPLAARDGQPHAITIRPSGSGQSLVAAASVTCAGPNYYGVVDGADCNYVYGWAWDHRPSTPVSVDLYADGQYVTTALADTFRPDLPGQGIGDGRHGYQIAIPDALRDGAAHTLTARFGGGGPPLSGSASVTCAAQTSCSPAQDLSSSEFVKGFYLGALARQPRPLELQYWNDALRTAAAQGQTPLSEKAKLLGRELFRQGEYAVRDAARPAAGKEEAYVSDLYWGYLQRGPDASGQGSWADGIRNTPAGQDGRLNTLAAFESSPEFAARVASVCPAPAESVRSYDAVADFSPLQNPDGAWSYGYRAPGGVFTAYANRADKWGAGTDTWARDTNGLFVTRNSTGASHTYPGATSVVQPANVLNLHPGPAGEKSVVRWTAAAAGNYLVQGSFKGIDTVGTTTDVAVAHNGTSVFGGNINSYGATSPFSLTRTVAAGDTLEFSVGANGNYNYDSTGLSVTISQPPPAQTQPYNGTATPLPGKLEAELFDAGGEGVAYHDATLGAQGQDFGQPAPFPVPAFRQPTDVDVNKAANYSNGYVVRMQAGDWMNYTVDVAQAGSYTLSAQTYYWGATGGTFHVEANGVDVTGPVQVPGGSAWLTVSKPVVQLAAGRHVLRVVCDSNGSDGQALGEVDYLLLAADADAGLVGHWKFDEGTAAAAADSSGGGNGGTLQSGASWAVARVGTAAAGFDGVDDYVQVGARPGLVMTTAATFGAWLYPTGAGSGGSLGGIVVNREGEYEIARFPDGTIQWAFANTSPGWNWVNTGYVASLNKWTHVAVTYDGGAVKTYADGQLVHAYSGAGSIGDVDTARHDFRVGGRQSMLQNFQGRLDDVRVYNRALSAAEVEALVAAAPADPTGNDFSDAKKDPANETGSGRDDPLSRNFNFSIPLVGLKGRAGLDLRLSLSYNSLVWTRDAATGAVKFDADYGDPSPGFRLGLPVIHRKHRNARGENAYMLVTPSGGRVELRQVGASNTYEATDSSYLQMTEDTGLTLRPTDGSQVSFALKGYEYKLTQIKDRNGNFISVSYNAAGNVSSITDTLGRVITFAYDANGRPTAVEQNRNGQVHQWATFGYANVTMGAQFADPSKVLGPANGTAISALNRVSLADGSFHAFLYNSWGQVYRVERRAADGSTSGRLLSYTEYDLQTPNAAHTGNWTDCPRFTQRKDFIKDWNNDAPAVTTYGAEGGAQVVIRQNGVLPNSLTPDFVKEKIYYEPAGTWRYGMTRKVETFSTRRDGQNADPNVYDLRRTAETTWTQDDETLAYKLNPRAQKVEVFDPQNSHRGTSYEYTSYGLRTEAKEWSGTESAVERRTHTEYNLDPAYVGRRVIGLVSSASVYDGQGHVASKVDYTYDQGGQFLQHQGEPVQHDGTNYGASFVTGRGMLTSVRRWDVTALHDVSKSVESRLGYNTTGSVVFMRDPLGHGPSISYTDRFADKGGTNTLAYPTAATDAGGYTSKTEYSFNTGQVVRAEDQRGAQQTFTYDAGGRPVRVERSGRDAATNQVVNGGYVRWVYSDALDAVQTWTKVEADKPEACSISITDGAGRVRATASDFPNSQGGYRAGFTVYDIAGRVWKQSNPTEISGLWNPAGDDASGWNWTVQTYDWKGRTLLVTNPGSPASTVEHLYEGCGCAGGQSATTRDEAGRRQRVAFDTLGRVQKSQLLFPQDKAAAFTDDLIEAVYSTTVNTYNALDQLVEVNTYAGAVETDPAKIQKTTFEYDGHGRLKTRREPDQTRAVTYEYYADDTLLRVLTPRELTGTAPQDVTTTITRNSRHLITKVEYAVPTALSDPASLSYVPASPTVEMSYDETGRRARMTDGLGAIDYTYDALGRMKKEKRTFNDPANQNMSGVIKEVGYDYNPADELKSVTDPAGNLVTYSYDNVGQLSKVKGVFNGAEVQYAYDLKYRAWGGVKSLSYGNGRALSQSYNQRLNLSHFEISGLVSMDYRYTTITGGTDDDGRVKYARDLTQANSPFDRAYRYDLAARLTEALTGTEARGGSVVDGPYRETYSYDVWDNITGRSTRNWFDQIDGQVPQITQSSGRKATWDYDAAGHVLRVDESNRRFKWDAAGRMIEMTDQLTRFNNITVTRTQKRSYDGDGRWLKESKNGAVMYNVRAAALGGAVLTELNSAGQKLKTNVYAKGELLARQENNEVVWQHSTPFGTSELETASNGALRERTELDPMNADVGTAPPETGGGGPEPEPEPLFPLAGDPSATTTGILIDGVEMPDVFVSMILNFGKGREGGAEGGGVGGQIAVEDHIWVDAWQDWSIPGDPNNNSDGGTTGSINVGYFLSVPRGVTGVQGGTQIAAAQKYKQPQPKLDAKLLQKLETAADICLRNFGARLVSFKPSAEGVDGSITIVAGPDNRRITINNYTGLNDFMIGILADADKGLKLGSTGKLGAIAGYTPRTGNPNGDNFTASNRGMMTSQTPDLSKVYGGFIETQFHEFAHGLGINLRGDGEAFDDPRTVGEAGKDFTDCISRELRKL